VIEALHREPKPRVFVIDTIGESDIDFTGARALEEVVGICEREGMAFGIARAGVHLHESLRRAGLAARIGEDRFFPTVDEAVRALSAEPPPPTPVAPED
jgi:MFS superfamily sulfate permease-like transporter